MRIRHNSASINTLRNFGINQTALNKDLEKLSSGYKINKAGDDAAGLAVSESMRERIKGLDQGHNNINDGMSLINVAEGGLNEITDMLQRMGKLSIQALNDTYNKGNREEIQLEIAQLKEEINRIADSTEFNDIKVLKIKGDDAIVEYKKEGLPEWMSTKGLVPEKDENGNIIYDAEGKKIYNEEMKVGNIPANYTQNTSDTSQIMKKFTGFNENGKFTYDVYGPAGTTVPDDDFSVYTYKGEFTPSLGDNLGAVISFKGLADKYDLANSDYSTSPKTAETLYKDVYELLGSSLGVSCATCEDPEVVDKHYYGFAFYGTAKDLDSGKVREYLLDGMKYTDANGNATHSVTENAIDISEIKCPDDNGVPLFDYLSYKIAQNPSPEDLSEAANIVAKRLYDKTYEKLKSFIQGEHHFNDARELNDDGKTPMTFAIFDYRDSKLLNTDEVKLQKSTTGRYIIHPDPIWIQCSSLADDRIPLKLPYVDISGLGLNTYDVSVYKTTTMDVYDPKDYARYIAERNNPAKWQTTVTTETQTIPPHKEPIKKYMPNEYGEMVEKTVGYRDVGEEVYVYKNSKTTFTGDPPKKIGTEEVEVYVPDDVNKITNAIDKISGFRAHIGVQYNRLEHARNNNETMNENVTASESRIRDTNMADAMSKYQKDSILMNVTERMLGTADESTRGILDLIG